VSWVSWEVRNPAQRPTNSKISPFQDCTYYRVVATVAALVNDGEGHSS
jgi:hypothetical protein